MPLTDKIAVITGATGQLGPVVARVLASHGIRIALCAPSQDELAGLVTKLGFPGSRILSVPLDLMNEASAVSLADAVIARFGRADILIHLVSGYQESTIYGLATEAWDYMLNLNLRTTLNVIRAFMPYMTANSWGRIITTSTPLADKPSAQSAAYSAAKAGMEALVLAVAQEGRDKGITANIVVVKTIDLAEARAAGGRPPGAASPEEIANLMVYLCSDEAAAVNGARIPMYGRG